jgi:hypothetical protein
VAEFDYPCLMYGAYTFRLEDETGAILVNVNGTWTPGVVLPVVTGTRVVVRGQVFVLSTGIVQVEASEFPHVAQ